jgi:hypothetical protein
MEAEGVLFEDAGKLAFEGDVGGGAAEAEGGGVGASETRCERAWRTRSWATRSVASRAAFMARVRGMVRREVAKAPIASCSREPWVGEEEG